MEVLQVNSQFNVGFNNEKGWSQPSPLESVPGEAALAGRLERELRAAKGGSTLAAASVLVPAAVLARAARQALRLAEAEPCGVRGAAVLVHVGGTPLAAFQIDPHTITTHEIHIHLQHHADNWTSMLPQFLKNLTRGGAVIISSEFTVTKKRLFRSEAE